MSLLLLRHRPRLPTPYLSSPLQHYSTRPPPTRNPFPGPPPLPAEEQAEFERLQKLASASPSPSQTQTQPQPQAPAQPTRSKPDPADPFFRNAKPEFNGDVNPKTGEAGGPKTEPLRWGGQGDWSYNGKVTDF